ncbi:NAD(P)/FAD-dependent oxidoreductase (plasmid) [Rhizobium leguminosarum]|jgi:flavin-dependent dehydrogenase
MNIDVLIVGGGPAGVIAATVLAGRGRDVLVIDNGKSRFGHGELLSPLGAALLNNIDNRLFDPANHLCTSRLLSDWGESRTIVAMTNPHNNRSAWHLDRRSFDLGIERVALLKGAQFKRGERLKSSVRCHHRGIWEVELTDGSAYTSRLLLDATGQNCSVARHNGGQRIVLDRMVATTAVLGTSSGECEFRIQSRPDGWWFATMIPGQKVVACFLTDAHYLPVGASERRRFWLQQLEAAPKIREYATLTETFEIKSTPAGSGYLESAIGDGWLAIGDAALSVDPLASAGLANSIRTSRMAALAADAVLAGEHRLLGAYQRYTRRMAENSEITRRAYYAMEQRWSSSFWMERHGARRLNVEVGIG